VQPSPILSSGIPNFQSQAFSGFSFSAFQVRPVVEIDEPPSPGGSSTRVAGGIDDGELSPTGSFSSTMSGTANGPSAIGGLMMIPNNVSSTNGESETESMPLTPLNSTFSDKINREDDKEVHKVRLQDPSMTPRAVHGF